MNEMRLPGIRFEAITMPVAPTAAKFPGQTIAAIRFAITDRQAYRPVRDIASSDRCDSSPASDRVCVEADRSTG